MTGPYAFFFDSAACTGCKACQVACKDKNHLPLGVLWRRVYEVTAGGWSRRGDAWTSTVFAYHLSMACNHCVHPKCAGVCPTDAFSVRPDGIVLIDAARCIGCKYCSWACPYGALQYDPFQGVMTKCNLCLDELEAGTLPACVAACPMRVLDLAGPDESGKRGIPYRAVYPMPDSRTEPRFFVRPHPAAGGKDLAPTLVNREEIAPRKASWSGREDSPLVAFTLLVQMAVGTLWASLWILHPLEVLSGQVSYRLIPLLVLGLIGLLLLLAGVASFAHLGRKRNAWRTLTHLRKSWLSREILLYLLFGSGWVATIIQALQGGNSFVLGWATSLVGLGLVFSMAQVYMLRTVPRWNSWRTLAGFLISSALLGQAAMVAVLIDAASTTGLDLSLPTLALIELPIALFLLTQASLTLSSVPWELGTGRVRTGLLLAAIAASASVVLAPGTLRPVISLVVFALALVEECLGRSQFYASRNILE